MFFDTSKASPDTDYSNMKATPLSLDGTREAFERLLNAPDAEPHVVVPPWFFDHCREIGLIDEQGRLRV